MPKVIPPGGEVSWPPNEGTLGVVGVAPWATIEFCNALYRKVDAKKDWHYPRLILDINTKIPSRGRHLQLGETDPSPVISETIRELAREGATVAVVVCNTAHILFDRWCNDLPIPVINIVDETVKRATASKSKLVAPLTSKSLAASDIYASAVERAGLKAHRIGEPYQGYINAVIESVKTSAKLGNVDETNMSDLIRHLKQVGVDSVILGCTELSVLQSVMLSCGLVAIDSNEALAEAALHTIAADV